MTNIRIGKQITVKVRDDIGVLAQLARLVGDRGVNLLATSNWVEGEMGVINLITDDHTRTVELLQSHGYAPVSKDVLLLRCAHKPGMLKHVTGLLADDDIGIRQLYATATSDADVCLMVIDSSHNDRALVLLQD